MWRVVSLLFVFVLAGSAAAETAAGDYSPALRNQIMAAISPMRSPPTMKVRQSGGAKPLFAGITDLPNGSILWVYLKKSATCAGDGCLAPTPPSGTAGDRVTVRNGGFQAGPFLLAGSPLPPGTYPIEIVLETGNADHMFYQAGVGQVVIPN